MSDLPFVSIIVPCRNEEKCIGTCLDSIIANDYPKEHLEVLVVDGLSEDGTRGIVQGYAERYSFIRLLENLKKITPAAFNLGVTNAMGEIIMIMGSHASYEKDYVSQCVESLNRYGADNVGGVMKTLPNEKGLIGQAIVLSLSHRFGVGNSYFRTYTKEPRWVDTVFGGCYKADVFKKIGLFKEELASSQDIEFNLRLKNAGGRILLDPRIVCYYYARSSVVSFCKNNIRNGIWVILPFAYSDVIPVSWRHLIPLLFVTTLLGSGLLGFISTIFLWIFVTILSAYGLANFAASLQIAWRERDLRYLFVMPFVFGMLHVGYGFGSLLAAIKMLRMRQFWSKLFGLEAKCETN